MWFSCAGYGAEVCFGVSEVAQKCVLVCLKWRGKGGFVGITRVGNGVSHGWHGAQVALRVGFVQCLRAHCGRGVW